MFETFINLGNPSWTDILQAIGAIVSSFGAITAFVLLFVKDKNKQKQINALTTMSEQLIDISKSQQQQITSLSILAKSSIDSLEKQGEMNNSLKELSETYNSLLKLTKARGR